MSASDASAVLIAGVYGSGKTSVAQEIADLLEQQLRPYALLDLDYLSWFDSGRVNGHVDQGVMLANLAAVVANYRAVGVRFFVLAGAIRGQSELEEIRAELGLALSVVRLTAPLEEIERRLRSNATTARRRDDLPTAAEWIAASTGEGIEDLTVPNDRPIREVAAEIVEWLGWARGSVGNEQA
jgi:gluconate kinase